MENIRKAAGWVGMASLGVLVAGIVGAALTPHLFGVSFVVVAGASMEPTLPYGGLAVMREVDPEAVEIGDVVQYPAPGDGAVTTHRVVDVTADGRFVMRGDANNVNDAEPVDRSTIEARHVTTIPHAGSAMQWARSTQGYLALVLVPGMAVLFWEGRSLFRTLRQPDGETAPSEESSGG